MQELKKNKPLFYLFVLSLLAFFGYFFFLRGGSTPSSAAAPAGQTNSVSAGLLSGLEQLSSAQINTALFTSPAWTSLHDLSTPLPTSAPGNQTLFAPAASQ